MHEKDKTIYTLIAVSTVVMLTIIIGTLYSSENFILKLTESTKKIKHIEETKGKPEKKVESEVKNEVSETNSKEKEEKITRLSEGELVSVTEIAKKSVVSARNGYDTYLISLKCPTEKYPINIQCTPDKDIKDQVYLSSFAANVYGRDQNGAYCAYGAKDTFEGTISANCTAEYFDTDAYDAANFNPGTASKLPQITQLWEKQISKSNNNGNQEVKLACPLGTTSFNVTCDSRSWDEIPPLINSYTKDNIAVCEYDLSKPEEYVIRTFCLNEES